MDEQVVDAEKLERFMDAACSKLGFCLSPEAKEALKQRLKLSSKEFVREFIASEGIKPAHLESYEHFGPLLKLYHQHVLDT